MWRGGICLSTASLSEGLSAQLRIGLHLDWACSGQGFPRDTARRWGKSNLADLRHWLGRKRNVVAHQLPGHVSAVAFRYKQAVP